MKHEHSKRCYDLDESPATFEKWKKKQNRPSNENEYVEKKKQRHESNFTCLNCGFPVICDREQSGVNNRNHCPRCLHSRHVDEQKAGDRKAVCKSRMEPIGLTLKQSPKRYASESQGELMLIHRCKGCGKTSINRIAADDDAAVIYNLFNQSSHLPEETKSLLLEEGIRLLGQKDLTTVYSQLFGWQAILEEFEVNANVKALQIGLLYNDEMEVKSEWQNSELTDPLNTL